MIKLRPYQQQAIDQIRQSMTSGNKRPLLVLPTGAGKTICFSYITQSAEQKNKRVMILVHRDSLFKQTSKTLSDFGVRHGLIGSGYKPNYGLSVQIAKVGTVVNRLDRFTPDLIIVDESHHCTAGQYVKIINAYPDARVIGVTATPIRTDGTGLDAMFDDIIIGATINELIDMGFLVAPRIFCPPSVVNTEGVKRSGGDFNRGELSELMDKPTITGDAVAHYKKLCDGVPAVAFCVSVKHAEHVAESFRAAGYRSECVHGAMKQDEIDRILFELGSGLIDVVTSCDLISEGTDIPAIGCAILLRPTMSLSLYLQQVGRALRLSAGKSEALILDHVGNVNRHGHPCDEREWSLSGTKKKKKTKDDEPTVMATECESCYRVYRPTLGACPSCGFVKTAKSREIEIIEGDLIEIERAELKKAMKKEVGRARTYDELLKLEKERGYKKGWAWHRFNSRSNRK